MTITRVRILRAPDDQELAAKIAEHLEGGERAIKCFMDDSTGSAMRGIHKVVLLWSANADRSPPFLREALAWHQTGQVHTILLKIQDPKIPDYIEDSSESSHAFTSNESMIAWLDNVFELASEMKPEPASVASFAQAASNYRSGVASRLSLLDVVGQEEEQQLLDFYVDVLLQDEVGDDSSLEERVLSKEGTKLFVEGVAGSGKSTLLRHLAYVLSTDEHLPFFISASEIIKSEYDTIDDFLRLTIKGMCTTSAKTTSELIMDGDNFPAESAVLFVDGIDEVSSDDRRKIKKMLSLFEVEHPTLRMVVSSRPTGWDPDLWEDFERLFVKPLTEDDIRGYISEHCAIESKDNLIQLVEMSPQVSELASVPFLLALIVAYSGNAQNLPSERAKLIAHCVESLISRRKRPEQRFIDNKQIMACLAFVSFRLFRLDSAGPHSEQEFNFAIEDYLNQANIPDMRNRNIRDEAEQLLYSLIERTGLLQFDSGDLSFVHRSVWEFFVGSQLATKSAISVRDFAQTGLWEEPIRLMVGLSDFDRFQDLISHTWAVNPGLALRALSETSLDGSDLIAKLITQTEAADLADLVRGMKDDLPHTVGRVKSELSCVDTLGSLLVSTDEAEIIVESILLLSQLKVMKERAREIISNKLDFRNSDKRKIDLKTSLEFIEVAGGQFMMGSDAPEATVDEKPPHLVELDTFYIADAPIQNKHVAACPFKIGYSDDPRSPTEEHPAIGVTWHEAFLIAIWFGCRLPTEAEWEFACRARGVDDAILFEVENIPDYAWYAENAENQTHPPRQKLANSLGIFDMMGNVREWCWDWFGQSYYEHCSTGVKNPTGPETGEKRVQRGGCFDWNTKNLVPSYRNSNIPSTRGFQNGVRFVEGLPTDILECLEAIPNAEESHD